MFFFFFSSRRRHTRWNCDWSSDVCSSDLCQPSYGMSVRTFEIVELSARGYAEVEVNGLTLAGSGRGWNRSGMHHIDLHQLENGSWMACVDGWSAVSGPRQLLRRTATNRS